MKKAVLLVMSLVLAATFTLAAGLGKGYGNMRQLNKQLSYTEVIKALDLSKEQAEQLLNVITETKEQLAQLEEEYKALLENSKSMTLNEFATQKRELNQKRAEILQNAEKKIADIVKVSQLQNLQQHYMNRFREFAQQYAQKRTMPERMPQRPFGRDGVSPMREKMMNRQFQAVERPGFGLGILLDDDFEEALRAYLQ
ncbi:MAG: hypothetical protein WHT65_01385 [Pseudothermotoga sp.]